MSALLLVPPDGEPLSLAEAKQFLRVAHDDDDAVISALIAAARAHVEAITRRMLLTQTWRLVLDAWAADGQLTPRIGPLQALLQAQVFDADGVAQALEVESFVVDIAANVIAAPRWVLPAPGRSHAGIALDVLCGYGADASDVPADLRQALRLLVAHGYEHRGLMAVGGAVAMQPVAGSVRVAVGGSEIEGSAFACDTTTGIVTFASGHIPAAGVAITAGFQFDVPVRFDTDYLEVDLSAFTAGAIPKIPLVEIRI